MLILIRRHRSMILVSIFFFYMGCGITLSLVRMECADTRIVEATGRSSVTNEVEYAVLVVTSPDNEEKRDSIRATWAKLSDNILVENGETLYKWTHTWAGDHTKHNLIKIYFAVGTRTLSNEKLAKLNNEIERSKDLLLLDVEDSYKTLTTKVLYALKWLNANLKGLKYVIKCDDDSFVRIDLIVSELEAFAPAMNAPALKNYVTYKSSLQSYKGLYWGYFDGRAKPFTRGKWQEKAWFLSDTYVPYALGGGYVISKSIVDFVARNADMLSLYNSEDVSMGVWTAALDQINRVHDIRFDTEWKTRGCSKNMLLRHKQTPKDMFQMYRTLVHSNGEILCKNETTLRKPYSYNWNVLPSKCCV